MKTYTRHIVFLQHIGKMGTHITRFDNLANLVYEDVIEIILVVVGAAQTTIFCLIRFHPEQHLLIWINKWECPTAGFCLCSVTGYKCVFAIYLCFLNGVLDCNCLIIKINRIPFQANNLAATQSIESRRNDSKFSRITLKDLEQFFNLFLIVDMTRVFFDFGKFHLVCGVCWDQVYFVRVRQCLVNIRMTVFYCIGGHMPYIHFICVIVLNVFGSECIQTNTRAVFIEIRDNSMEYNLLIRTVGGDCYLCLRHFQPLSEKGCKKWGRVYQARVDIVCRIVLPPSNGNCVIQGRADCPVDRQQGFVSNSIQISLIIQKCNQLFIRYFCNFDIVRRKVWCNACSDIVGIICILVRRNVAGLVIQPLFKKIRKGHSFRGGTVARIKLRACLEQHFLRPLFISFYRQAGADGLGSSPSGIIFPCENHLEHAVLFPQMTCNHVQTSCSVVSVASVWLYGSTGTEFEQVCRPALSFSMKAITLTFGIR